MAESHIGKRDKDESAAVRKCEPSKHKRCENSVITELLSELPALCDTDMNYLRSLTPDDRNLVTGVEPPENELVVLTSVVLKESWPGEALGILPFQRNPNKTLENVEAVYYDVPCNNDPCNRCRGNPDNPHSLVCGATLIGCPISLLKVFVKRLRRLYPDYIVAKFGGLGTVGMAWLLYTIEALFCSDIVVVPIDDLERICRRAVTTCDYQITGLPGKTRKLGTANISDIISSLRLLPDTPVELLNYRFTDAMCQAIKWNRVVMYHHDERSIDTEEDYHDLERYRPALFRVADVICLPQSVRTNGPVIMRNGYGFYRIRSKSDQRARALISSDSDESETTEAKQHGLPGREIRGKVLSRNWLSCSDYRLSPRLPDFIKYHRIEIPLTPMEEHLDSLRYPNQYDPTGKIPVNIARSMLGHSQKDYIAWLGRQREALSITMNKCHQYTLFSGINLREEKALEKMLAEQLNFLKLADAEREEWMTAHEIKLIRAELDRIDVILIHFEKEMRTLGLIDKAVSAGLPWISCLFPKACVSFQALMETPEGAQLFKSVLNTSIEEQCDIVWNHKDDGLSLFHHALGEKSQGSLVNLVHSYQHYETVYEPANFIPLSIYSFVRTTGSIRGLFDTLFDSAPEVLDCAESIRSCIKTMKILSHYRKENSLETAFHAAQLHGLHKFLEGMFKIMVSYISQQIDSECTSVHECESCDNTNREFPLGNIAIAWGCGHKVCEYCMLGYYYGENDGYGWDCPICDKGHDLIYVTCSASNYTSHEEHVSEIFRSVSRGLGRNVTNLPFRESTPSRDIALVAVMQSLPPDSSVLLITDSYKILQREAHISGTCCPWGLPRDTTGPVEWVFTYPDSLKSGGLCASGPCILRSGLDPVQLGTGARDSDSDSDDDMDELKIERFADTWNSEWPIYTCVARSNASSSIYKDIAAAYEHGPYNWVIVNSRDTDWTDNVLGGLLPLKQGLVNVIQIVPKEESE